MNDTSKPPPDWQRLFPARGYRSSMAVRRGVAPGEYFNEAGDEEVLAERQRWFTETPEFFSRIEADAGELLAEFEGFIAEWCVVTPATSSQSLFDRCVKLGCELAPDWVLMRAGPDCVYRLAAGAVCFPSSWDLREKLGKPMEAIHDPVPGLNAQLGAKINSFLRGLPACEPWERVNFSFCGNTELNHHTSRKLTKLNAQSTLDGAWLRLERQYFFKLPRTGAIVFGIRVSHHGFRAMASVESGAKLLADALETMQDDMAAYKGLMAARPVLIAQLRHLSSSNSNEMPEKS